jgi:hypothetical protein
MKLLINSAMIPNPGTFRYEEMSQDLAIGWIRSNKFTSYIGYSQNAEYLTQLTGIPIEVNRSLFTVEVGDVALVMKLAYRMDKPKGSPVDDFVYGILERIE